MNFEDYQPPTPPDSKELARVMITVFLVMADLLLLLFYLAQGVN